MPPDSDLLAMSERLFTVWANERKFTLFSRAPLRRCWYAAFEAGAEVGAELAKPKRRKREPTT